MSQELLHIMEQLRREKDIDKDVLIDVIESAVLSASKKKYSNSDNVSVKLNLESGDIEVFRCLNIVDDVTDPELEISEEDAKAIDANAEGTVLVKLEKAKFGRVAAQTAKQLIFQKLRDAEKEQLYKEFKAKENEILNGAILRFERNDIIVDLGKVEAVVPYTEQSPRERYNKGDIIRVYILNVQKKLRGLQVIASRSHPDFVKKLFLMEVPEIAENIVEVVNIVREAGGRSKISVTSNDKRIDPVGTCVGIKGIRVQRVVQELHGEKIDIIKWTDELPVYVGNALSPATITKVTREKDGSMRAVVAEDQLSLAIGKSGQNARLASKLTNCKIDICVQQSPKQEQELALGRIAEERHRMVDALSIEPGLADELICAGFDTLEIIGSSDPNMLSGQVSDISVERAGELIDSATKALLDEEEPLEFTDEVDTDEADTDEADTDEADTDEADTDEADTDEADTDEANAGE